MPKLRMKMRRIAPIIILSSVLVLTTFSASAQDARIQVVGSLTSLIDVAVGSAKEHSLTLRNPGTEPAHAVVRTVELVFDEFGGYSLVEEEPGGRSNSSWVSTPEAPVEVPAGATVTVPITISAPQDAEGSYWSALVVEPTTRESQNFILGEAEIPVVYRTRYAGVLITNVSGTGRAHFQFDPSSLAVDSNDGGVSLSIGGIVEGDLASSYRLTAQLFNDQGERIGSAEANHILIPGQYRSFSLSFPKAPDPGSYSGVLMADGGGDSVTAFEIEVDVP